MILRDYQQQLIDKINSSTSKRNCIQSATGSGKTIIFSHLANNYNGNVLILVNRVELLEQTAKNITRTISLITAKTKKIGAGEVKIGMVESVHNRIKKGIFSLDNIDLIIVDEIQNLQFVKVFEGYEKRLLGFTATPVILKKEYYYKCKYCEQIKENKTTCCGKETKKYKTTVSLKRWYGDLITGIKIEELIDRNFLTKDHVFICDNQNLEDLETDSTGEYTSKSQNEVFNNLSSTNNLIANYEEHSLGLKTMVFNTNIEANNEACKLFRDKGYSVRSFDSRSKQKRKEVVEWFRNSHNGILMSVGVFTTGFDVDDVECIIMNRATQSLSLYHQIIGRGGRITDKKFKPFFKVIDLGGNTSRFGQWSTPVDWNRIYNTEVEKKSQENPVEDFITCIGCGAMINEYDCEYCGQEKPEKKARSEVKIATEVKPLPPPNAEHIINYCLKNDLDVNDAKNTTASYILDMFICKQTKRDNVILNKDYIEMKLRQIVVTIYHQIHKSELKGNRKRTIKDFSKKITNKINKHYDL